MAAASDGGNVVREEFVAVVPRIVEVYGFEGADRSDGRDALGIVATAGIV